MNVSKYMWSISLLSSFMSVYTNAMERPTAHHHQQKTAKHEIPEYVAAFIELFKTNVINPHNFEQKMGGDVFNGPEFSNPMSFPMKELQKLASFAEQSDIKGSVFHLFKELETQQSNQIHYSENKKKFFIINHLLGNPETISISEKYAQQFITEQFGPPHEFPIYAYVLLDSGTVQEQALALKCLESIMKTQGEELLAPLILMLLFSVKDQAKVSAFIKSIVNKLPIYRQNYLPGAIQVASVLFDQQEYHKIAEEFIESCLQLQEPRGQSPVTIVIQGLLQSPQTKDYASHLLEERVLPSPNIKAKDKWMIVQNFLWQDKSKAMGYLDTIWKVNHSNEDHAQLLFEAIIHPDLQAFLLPKIRENFDIMLKVPTTIPQHEVGMNFDSLIRFLSSLNHDSLVQLQGQINLLINVIFHLPANIFTGIQAVHVVQLIQNSGLHPEKTLIDYSKSPTAAPEFFIMLCKSMPENEHFLLKVYKGQGTNPSLKTMILIEFLKKIDWDHNLQKIITKDEILRDFYEQFKQSNDIDQKIKLFQDIAYNNIINKQSKDFEGMFNEFVAEAKNPKNSHELRLEIINLLESSNPNSPHLVPLLSYQKMSEHLANLEAKIKRDVYGITPIHDNIHVPHAEVAVTQLKSIVDHLLEDFHSYHFQGVPFDQNDLISKTKAILENNQLMKKALGNLGSEMEKYVKEAKENLNILESAHVWNEPNLELESNKIDGQTITTGQIYSLFLYYIERQKDKPSYISLIAGLVQALASTDAMKGCKTGSMSGMGNATFKDEFKKEGQKETRSFQNYIDVVSNKLTRLKTIMIYLLSRAKPGNSTFDIHDELIKKLLVKEFNDHDIESNGFLIETFQIFNQTPLEHIFGDEIHMIGEIFSKANSHTYHPSPEEEQLMKDAHTLIINPAILALLSKEYSDFVVFTPNLRDGTKLSYPDYVGFIEEDVPYKPELISSINHTAKSLS